METVDGDIYRAVALPGSVELRASGPDDEVSMTVDVLFARFNVWNRIRSVWEGDFLERLLPGAFEATMAERGSAIKALFDHGHDPSIGNKPLGPIDEMGERDEGPFIVVPMLDTRYNRELVPGIVAGVYGASYRFRVVAESWDEEPDVSEGNPTALPERTIERVDLFEAGVVTFPADEGTVVGVRSLTDRYRSGTPPVRDRGEDSSTGEGAPSEGLTEQQARRAYDVRHNEIKGH